MRRTGPTQAVRDLVSARDRACIACGGFDYLQVHHRRPRGAGGTRRPETNAAPNLVLLCLDCHAFVESHRETALDRGLLLPQNADPSSVPLIHHGEWVRLTDDGTVVPIDAAPGAATPSVRSGEAAALGTPGGAA